MKLYAWGANNYGQLGLGYVCEQCIYPMEVMKNAFLHDSIKQITGGGGHTFILDNVHRVYGCGLNNALQLGLSDSNNLSEFKRIECLDKYRISEIACGWDSSFAITEEEHALVWGSNTFGQLGLPKNKVGKTGEPICLPYSGVVQISSGLRHTAILLDNGKVLVGGQGRKGQLGLMKDDQPLTQTDSFQEVPYLENIVTIACGQHHTMALTRDGNLLAWGDNKRGQLGCDQSHPCVYTPMLIKSIIFSHNVISMQAGWTHSVFHTVDGLVVNFGRNCYGQLGWPQESRPVTWAPQYISFNERIKQLAVGSEHNFIVTDGGEVWSWGWNEHGNCGLSNDTNVYSPTRIKLPSLAHLIGTGSAHSFALVE